MSALPVILWVLSLVLVGCSESHRAASGTRCCVETDAEGWGRLSTCFCPAGVACNYAPFADCGDAVCRTSLRLEPGMCEDVPDGGPPRVDGGPLGTDGGDRLPDAAPTADAGPDALSGYYEPCCEAGPDGIGHVSTCFCPAGWACNYGWFVSCGGDTCAFSECPGDAGALDAQGAVDAGAGTGA